MTLTQQKQQLLAILFILAVVVILALSFATFEVVQHMNGMWHVMHSLADGGLNIMSGGH